MSKARTKEARFVLALYRTLKERGDLWAPISREEIARAVGLHTKAVQNICKVLRQANFIKILDDEEIVLTKQGEELALSILGQK